MFNAPVLKNVYIDPSENTFFSTEVVFGCVGSQFWACLISRFSHCCSKTGTFLSVLTKGGTFVEQTQNFC